MATKPKLEQWSPPNLIHILDWTCKNIPSNLKLIQNNQSVTDLCIKTKPRFRLRASNVKKKTNMHAYAYYNGYSVNAYNNKN